MNFKKLYLLCVFLLVIISLGVTFAENNDTLADSLQDCPQGNFVGEYVHNDDGFDQNHDISEEFEDMNCESDMLSQSFDGNHENSISNKTEDALENILMSEDNYGDIMEKSAASSSQMLIPTDEVDLVMSDDNIYRIGEKATIVSINTEKWGKDFLVSLERVNGWTWDEELDREAYIVTPVMSKKIHLKNGRALWTSSDLDLGEYLVNVYNEDNKKLFYDNFYVVPIKVDIPKEIDYRNPGKVSVLMPKDTVGNLTVSYSYYVNDGISSYWMYEGEVTAPFKDGYASVDLPELFKARWQLTVVCDTENYGQFTFYGSQYLDYFSDDAGVFEDYFSDDSSELTGEVQIYAGSDNDNNSGVNSGYKNSTGNPLNLLLMALFVSVLNLRRFGK